MPLSELKLEQFEDHFTKIDEALNTRSNSRVPLVEEMGAYAVLGGGKRLRPLLFVLCCELCNYKGANRYELSTVFEYIHVASLLHDDVLDNANTRRKRPSTNQVWGNQGAVLEGDFLYAKALSVAVRAQSIPFFIQLTDTTVEMTEGQILELSHHNDWHLTRAQYMDIISAKTASLISGACVCGAIIAEAPPETQRALTRFGLNIGIAFQLIDDLLDYTSSEAEFGKPVGKDLREGKITLPLIYTLSELEQDHIKQLRDRCTRPETRDIAVADMIRLVRAGDAVKRTWEEARSYGSRAVEFLEIFPDSPLRTTFRKLARYIIERRY
ncbi:MAG: polyprenyl synthetase family protein [Deltaproteobacteria bacterium]|nr:polyprenyl synthetase family protein [Deltaproteobacteria bacterium]